MGKLFRAVTGGISSDRQDHKVTWATGQIREVDDEMAAYHRNHTDAFKEIVGVVSGTGVAATESGAGSIRTTRLTLTNVAQAVVNGTEYQSTKIYTFPEGRILLLGTVASLAQTTTSAILTTLNSATGAVSLGSAAASNVSLTSGMVDIAPSTAFTSSATINVAGTAVNPVLATSAQLDGHTTAVPVYLNSAYATTTDVDADATQTWSGTVDLTWVWLGDF